MIWIDVAKESKARKEEEKPSISLTLNDVSNSGNGNKIFLSRSISPNRTPKLDNRFNNVNKHEHGKTTL